MRVHDLGDNVLLAYIRGWSDALDAVPVPEWSAFHYPQTPWRVCILCRVFNVYTQYDIDEALLYAMRPGAWQALQERIVVQAAVERMRRNTPRFSARLSAWQQAMAGNVTNETRA